MSDERKEETWEKSLSKLLAKHQVKPGLAVEIFGLVDARLFSDRAELVERIEKEKEASLTSIYDMAYNDGLDKAISVIKEHK